MENTQTPSPQQQAVYNFVQDPTKGSLNLIARAGTGKTSTLMGIARIIKEPAFLGAFNKAIADEFKERLANQKSFHVKGGTIHSAGFAAWGKLNRNLGSPDTRKVEKLVKTRLSAAAYDKKLVGAIVDAVGYAKQACLGVVGQPSFESDAPWQAIIDYYDLADEIPGRYKDGFVRYCQDVYRDSLAQCERVIDFDDMLLAPLYFEAPFTKYKWVMIDEAQDTNTARRLVAFAMMGPGSRMIAVGDPAQAIYGFAGADSNSMELIKAALGSEELPLSVTYRCPKSVVSLAQSWVPDFTAHQDAPQGLVTELKHSDLWKQSLAWNDVILCRNTRPLAGIASRLRDMNIPCVVEGMNSKGLLSLAVKWGDDIEIEEFLEMLGAYEHKETAKWVAKGKMDKAEYIQDKAGTLRTLAKSIKRTGATIQDLVRRIEFIFGTTNDGRVLKLCTIHRSKGREWNRVYLIGRNRYQPSPYAKKDWEQEQERNLMYVAATRAKVELVEVLVPFRKPGDDTEWWEKGWREAPDTDYGEDRDWNAEKNFPS